MYKHILVGFGIAGILIVSASIVAQPAFALTAEEIQTQIKELLAKIADLTNQLRALQNAARSSSQEIPGSDLVSSAFATSTVHSVSAPLSHRVCALLKRNLSHGAQGDDVTGLQEFLSSSGHLSVGATGFFGPLTEQALARWQQSQGIDAAGVVGPLTRARIKELCVGGTGNTEKFSASPTQGGAPLTVVFSTRIAGNRPASDSYTIDFGDGTSEPAAHCFAPNDACSSPGQNKHIYSSNGTYTATLIKKVYMCQTTSIPPGYGCPEETVVGKVHITVGPVACTKEYKPVCGNTGIVCITTPCPSQKTYGNRCMMNADGAAFLYEGQCRTDPPNCLAVAYQRPICAPGETAVPVDPTSPCPGPWKCVSGNKPPTISGFSGPTTLAVNQTGTWTIQASDPENGSLSYGIIWGDGRDMSPVAYGASLVPEFVQTTTFTHSFITAGTYTVTIVVRDASGNEAKTTSTVKVGDGVVQTSGLSASPTSGVAPLTVSFLGIVNSAGYSIDFGDGTTSGDIGCSHGGCPFPPTLTNVNVNHIYTSAGTYVAKLRRHFTSNESNCAGVDCNVVGTATITVTGQTSAQ